MPKKICNSAGCNNLAPFDTGYCTEHKNKQADYNRHRRDKESDRFYHSRAWLNKRKEVMERDGGLCQECLANGDIVSADVVDHIIDLKQDKDKALDCDNLVAMCHEHHNQKKRIDS